MSAPYFLSFPSRTSILPVHCQPGGGVSPLTDHVGTF